MRKQLIVLLGVFALTAAACSGGSSNEASATTASAATSPDETTPSEPGDTVAATEETTPETTSAPATDTTEPDSDPEQPVGAPVGVGAASRSILPTVDGSRDYLDLISNDDPYSPGLFIPEWDDGRIAVGNGDELSRWVHDDLRVSAVALEDADGEIMVVVSFDLYMIFRQDGEALREGVLNALPADVAERVTIVFGSTHVHEGPDTAFDVNHTWFEIMLNQSTETILEAIGAIDEGTLRYGFTEHWFGVAARRDPRIIDPSLHTLQATAANGDVVATIVGWANHPEVVLGFEPSVSPEDCALLAEIEDLGDEECSARGRFLSADYVGAMRNTVQDEFGGEVLFLNGALGAMLSPLQAPVWEVTDEHPVGDGYTVPDGAGIPAGDTDYKAANFRRMEVVGEQLGLAAIGSLEQGQNLENTDLSFEESDFFTPLSHIGFRIIGAIDEETGYSGLGHTTTDLFTCPEGEKTTETCVSDNAESTEDGLIGETVRNGDYIHSAVGYLQVGPVGMMFIPGEIQSQLTIGLPAGFDETPEQWYDDPDFHAVGSDLEIPGYVYDMMPNDNKWVISLGGDELGYVIPTSDWKVLCVGDEILGEGACQDLADRGGLAAADAVAGNVCVGITEGGTDYLETILPIGEYEDIDRQVVMFSCTYGQALGRDSDPPQEHYEETASAGWGLADDILGAVAELTGGSLGGRINEDFAGYWEANPSPAD